MITHASHSWYCGTQFHRYPIKSSFYIVVIASCVMHSTRYVTEAMCCSNYSRELTMSQLNIHCLNVCHPAPFHTLHPPTPCTLPHPAPSHTLHPPTHCFWKCLWKQYLSTSNTCVKELYISLPGLRERSHSSSGREKSCP